MESIRKKQEEAQVSEQQTQDILNSNIQQRQVTSVGATAPSTVTEAATNALTNAANSVQDNMNKAIAKTVEQSENVRDMTRDLTFLKGASDLQTNDKFTKSYQSELAGQLLSDLKNEGTRQAIVDEAKRLEARTLRNEAYYSGFADMFRMMKINSSFGLFPMILLTIVILPLYLIFKVIGFIFTAVNEVLSAIVEFRKPAKALCYTVLIAMITILIVLLVTWFADWLFGWNLMEFFRSLIPSNTTPVEAIIIK